MSTIIVMVLSTLKKIIVIMAIIRTMIIMIITTLMIGRMTCQIANNSISNTKNNYDA